jgi:hypothetical protein
LHNFAEADFAPYLMMEALGQRMASNKDIEGWVKRFLMTYISIDASCFSAAISSSNSPYATGQGHAALID